ncbi:MAG: hypothetical protein ABR553_09645 [Gammaproteobacteria bacterium]
MTIRNLALRALAAFLAFNLLALFVTITPYGLLLALSVSASVLLIDHRNGLLLVISSFVLVLMLEGFVRFSGNSVITTYYRAHEMLAEETRYRANQRIEMREAHGDLLAIDPSLDHALSQPREVVFQTDSKGFRNDAEQAAGQVLVVGDSFVVGIGNTQADTLTAQMGRNHGLSAYNMGFPAGPFQYANIIEAARAELGEDACIVAVVFEGNDFRDIDPAELAARKAVPRGAQNIVKTYLGVLRSPFEVSRVFFGLYTQGLERLRKRSAGSEAQGAPAEVTLVLPVAGAPMVFLKGYAQVVLREGYDDFGYMHDQFARGTPDLLVFAPEKYRVYGPLLDQNPAGELPQAQLAHLAKIAGDLDVPLLDLTEALSSRARELLSQGELIYWRDDSHWNRAGIEVGAREIVRTLASHHKGACNTALAVNLSAMSP